MFETQAIIKENQIRGTNIMKEKPQEVVAIEMPEYLIEDLQDIVWNYSVMMMQLRNRWIMQHMVSDKDEDECLEMIHKSDIARQTLIRVMDNFCDSLGDHNLFSVVETSLDELDDYHKEKILDMQERTSAV